MMTNKDVKPGKKDSREGETIDVSRRKLLGKAGKAAYVAPALTFLSFTVSAQDPPPYPSFCPPELACDQGNTATPDVSSNNRRKKRNKPE